MDSIRVDTGEKEISIERNGTVVGQLVFNPSDVAFAERFQSLYAELKIKLDENKEKAKEIDKHDEVDENGIPLNSKERLAFIREICEYMKTKVDELFGKGTSQMVFGDAVGLTMFEQFFQGITPYARGTRTKKVARYTTSASEKRDKRKVAK